MTDLFNTSYLPDTRNIVHQQRIEQLRRQAQNLTEHQNKLNDELTRLDEQFNERKRKLESHSAKFVEKMKKVIEEKPHMGEERYNTMVAEWEETIKKNYESYLERNQQRRPSASEKPESSNDGANSTTQPETAMEEDSQVPNANNGEPKASDPVAEQQA